MRKAYRWFSAAVALLLAGGSALYLRHKGAPRRGEPIEQVREPANAIWAGFAPGPVMPNVVPPPDGAAPGSWTASEIPAHQLEEAMTAWRRSIIEKRSDAVIALDQAFAALPGRYGPELVRSAQTDPEERVRAFSTRVLGKFKNARLAGLFEGLLADKSPFVRQNAAWALGELAAQPEGRRAAQPAISDLEEVQDSDPAQDVRVAASDALRKLQ